MATMVRISAQNGLSLTYPNKYTREYAEQLLLNYNNNGSVGEQKMWDLTVK